MKRPVSIQFGGHEISIHRSLVPLPITQMPRQKVIDDSGEADSEKEHSNGRRAWITSVHAKHPHGESNIRRQGNQLRGSRIVAWGKCSDKGRVRSELGGRDTLIRALIGYKVLPESTSLWQPKSCVTAGFGRAGGGGRGFFRGARAAAADAVEGAA